MKLNNRQDLRTLRSDLQAALSDLETKHGITFNVGRMTYEADGSMAKIKLSAVSGEAPGNVGDLGTPEAVEYATRAPEFGLEKAWLGREFNCVHGTFKLVGLKPRARKYPVVAQAENGKRYKMPVAIVRSAFAD